jgi:hypothetical protein
MRTIADSSISHAADTAPSDSRYLIVEIQRAICGQVCWRAREPMNTGHMMRRQGFIRQMFI